MPSQLPTVKLYTTRGEFVTEQSNLPWVLLPEVLVWGQRHFVWKPAYDQYREAAGVFYIIAAAPPEDPPPEDPTPGGVGFGM